MDIGNALHRAWRDDITTRSIIANTVKEIYGKDISIISVRIHGQKILIKTGKSLVNFELQLMAEDIKIASLEKLWRLWIQLSPSIEIRFL